MINSHSFILPLLFIILPSFDPNFEVVAAISYANEFIDPNYFFNTDFGENTRGARDTIVEWAAELAARGPWSVMNKTGTPPSGDKHDYLSWAPYWFPDCSGVDNTTELTPEEVWRTCPYTNAGHDGEFNPDVRLVNDIGEFDDLADAVLYNSISWALERIPSSVYSQNVATFIRIWFLDEATRMNPHLNFSQLKRGPGDQVGSRTGVLDLKSITKIVTGILILRQGRSADWTTALDEEMNAWSRQYIAWLETSPLALDESHSANNHGSFYYNQLASLKILVGDLNGAQNVTNTFFEHQYQSQIIASGEQPLEAARTRPYHYRAYNLAAMIMSARMAVYSGSSASIWNKTTFEGATIQTALDFAMSISPLDSGESDYAAELYPNVATVASVYGDPDGKYVEFLSKVDPRYPFEPFFLWNQPLAGDPSLSSGNNDGRPISSGSRSCINWGTWACGVAVVLWSL